MTTTELAQLPSVANPAAWTPKQANLMQFAGLAQIIQGTGEVTLKVEIGVVEAFLQVCALTGLNPAMKQIYAANMGGKYTIIVGIDGMRLIAQRTGEYEGQTAKEWMTPQGQWVTAWTPELWGGQPADRPLAARVGIYRHGFREALFYTVTFEEFGQRPSGARDNWNVRPAHMLGIRAESHGLRSAFPNELSGVYTREDVEAENLSEEGVDDEKAALAEIQAVTDADELPRLYHKLDADGRITENVRIEFMTQAGKIRGQAEAAEQGAPPAAEPSGDENTEDAVVVTDDETGPEEAAQPAGDEVDQEVADQFPDLTDEQRAGIAATRRKARENTGAR